MSCAERLYKKVYRNESFRMNGCLDKVKRKLVYLTKCYYKHFLVSSATQLRVPNDTVLNISMISTTAFKSFLPKTVWYKAYNRRV